MDYFRLVQELDPENAAVAEQIKNLEESMMKKEAIQKPAVMNY